MKVRYEKRKGKGSDDLRLLLSLASPCTYQLRLVNQHYDELCSLCSLASFSLTSRTRASLEGEREREREREREEEEERGRERESGRGKNEGKEGRGGRTDIREGRRERQTKGKDTIIEWGHV